MVTVIKDVLFHRRQYFAEKVQAPLVKAIHGLGKQGTTWLRRVNLLFEIVELARLYPELTEDNVIFKNTRIRMDIRAYFKEHLKARGDVADIGLGLLSAKCEVDGFYEFLHDEYIVQLLRRGWRPAKRGFPMWRYWDGPLPTDYVQESSPEWLEKFMVYLEEWDYPTKGKYQQLNERIKERQLVNK